MAKDPAVLFYYQDFLVGTAFLTNEQVGAYQRILCHLFDKGTLAETDMKKICITSECWNAIKDKFVQDENGELYNVRSREEKLKRVKFSESRANNRKNKEYPYNSKEDMKNISLSSDEDMENENGNINESLIKNKERVISSSPEITIEEVISYFDSLGFSKIDAQNFFSHYSAQNWETSGMYGRSIKANWRNKVIQWMNNQKQYNKPAIPDHNNLNPTKKTKCEFCGEHAVLWIDGIAACSYDHYQQAKNKRKKK